MEKIMMLASIRKFVSESFTDEHVHDGTYFDVFNIEIPSEDGDYSTYDGIVIVSRKQAEFVNSILADTNLRVACVIK